jgi:hypothetical protein
MHRAHLADQSGAPAPALLPSEGARFRIKPIRREVEGRRSTVGFRARVSF